MIPYKEIKHATTGEIVRRPWPANKASAKLNEIRGQVVRELNERDVQQARQFGSVETVTVDGLDGKPMEVIRGLKLEQHKDGTSFMARNEIELRPGVTIPAGKLTHSGAETMDRVRERWYEFCSTPQDDEKYNPAAIRPKPKQPMRLDSPVTATPVQEEAASRRRDFQGTADSAALPSGTRVKKG